MKRTPAVAPVIEPGAPTGRGAWFDRCLALRDRWLASPVFQRRATAFAPTRWLARRRAGQLFDLVAGFVYSQALTAAVRLRLFEVLAEAPQPAEALAERLALPLDSMRRLLDALVALRLVERRTHDRYGLGPLGAPMVGNAALIAMVEHHAALYQDLAAPVRLLRAAPADRRSTALSGYWAYDAAGQVGAPPFAGRRIGCRAGRCGGRGLHAPDVCLATAGRRRGARRLAAGAALLPARRRRG